MGTVKKHIIFDLDDTIWDFQQNSKDALLELWADFKLHDYGVSSIHFLKVFREVNNALWDQFDEGKINREVIRKLRFPTVFKKLSLNLNGVAMQMQDSFMQVCSAKTTLVHGALEVLEKYKSNYKFHILSNGFDEIQFTKIKSSGISQYFDTVITSGRAGYRKPEPEIFDFALAEMEALKEECIMIGDNPVSDIEGAYNYGMDQIYYNVHQKECAITPNYTITDMNELLQLL